MLENRSTRITGETNALIIFTDIIESARHSTVLGISEYARRILTFQGIFKELCNIYFPKESSNNSFCTFSTRGDEGFIFNINPDIKKNRTMYKAVQFALELKAVMRAEQINGLNPPPYPMDVGIGIHYGPVATLARQGAENISGIEGLAINYGKRVETSSRMGKYSKIFLSRDAACLLDGEPVILCKYITSLKGINDSENVFEVRSAYLEKVPLDQRYYQRFLDNYVNNTNGDFFPKDGWINSIIISMLDHLIKQSGNIQKAKYLEQFSNFIWRDISENDPLILFYRAHECEKDGKITQVFSYLQTLATKYPSFVHARKKLGQVCWQLANDPSKYIEFLLARDTADQFLTHYLYYLSDDEKYLFQKIKDMDFENTDFKNMSSINNVEVQ